MGYFDTRMNIKSSYSSLADYLFSWFQLSGVGPAGGGESLHREGQRAEVSEAAEDRQLQTPGTAGHVTP